MPRIDYDRLAKANATRNRDGLWTEGHSLCPHSGEPIVSQKETARRLGITARALRDTHLPPFISQRRGGRTWYHLDLVQIFERVRQNKARPAFLSLNGQSAMAPLEAFLTDTKEDKFHDPAQEMLAQIDQIPAMAAALSGGGPTKCHIDPVGAQKLALLAREMQLVAKEHSGVCGVYGEDPQGNHSPDPNPQRNDWDYSELGGDETAPKRALASRLDTAALIEKLEKKGGLDG